MDIGRQQRVIRVEPLVEPEMAPPPARKDPEPATASGITPGGRHGSARRRQHRSRPILDPREQGTHAQGDE